LRATFGRGRVGDCACGRDELQERR
jgi:hypothetical protein